MSMAYAASFMEDERDTPLTMNERGVLVYMCSIAHDRDNPPRYWGGRDAIARYALGRVVPMEDSDAAKKSRRSIYESVRQAVEALVARGAIERIGSAYPGRSQEYAITVENLTTLQGEIGPSASTAWANNKERLQMDQAHVGPETKHTKDQERTPRSPTRAPHVQPVENVA